MKLSECEKLEIRTECARIIARSQLTNSYDMDYFTDYCEALYKWITK